MHGTEALCFVLPFFFYFFLSIVLSFESYISCPILKFAFLFLVGFFFAAGECLLLSFCWFYIRPGIKKMGIKK